MSAKHPPLSELKSNAISGYHYDPATKVLHLRFTSGDVWRYPGVPAETARNFAMAVSHGQFFHAHIRKHHEGTKVA